MAYGGEFTPPQYEDIVVEHSSLPGLLTSVDFIPACLESRVFGEAKFETFPVLITRANEYLSIHREWEAKTCESVEFVCTKLSKKSSNIKWEKMTYYEPGEDSLGIAYIRGLRLWLVPRAMKYPQQLGYVNIVPKAVNSSRWRWPDFQTLNETLEEFNAEVRNNPKLIPGKIITVETQEMKATTPKSFNPDKSFWYETESWKRFIVVIRVFYEMYINPKDSYPQEEIGIADFKPAILVEGRTFSKPIFEPFSNVIQNASLWCSQQRAIRYCNAQTFEVKMKSWKEVDTQQMTYVERFTYYVRIVRVAFVTLTEDRVAPPLNLTCKNFLPLLTVKNYSGNEYETLSKTIERIQEWLRATGGKVLSCETAAMRLHSGGERKHGLETSFTYNSTMGEFWIFVIRVFLDGHYPEPPPEVLSPPPEVKEISCVLL